MNLSILSKMNQERKEKLKCTLVVPNFRWSDWDVNSLWHFFPYNLCLIAAVLESVCDVDILDAYQADMDEEQFKEQIKQRRPDIVGITVLMDQYAKSGHKAASLIKSINEDITVILGGVYATTNPEKAAMDTNIDYVMIGEGEYVLRDLVGFFMKKNAFPTKGLCYRENGNIINTGHSNFIMNLDELPLPAYHLIDFQKYAHSAHRKSVDSPRDYPYARIMTSRGCPFQCVFCQVESIMGRKFRARSPKKILDEIQFLKETYGVKSLIFDDDNLYTDKKRAKDLFRGMIERNLVMPWISIAVAVFRLDEELVKLMRQSGCVYIDIAIESGTERVLKEIIQKPVNYDHAKAMVRLAKREGIYVAANFIVGFPTETWDEIRQTIRFAEELDTDYTKLFAAIPLPNTRLWKLCEETNSFKKSFSKKDIRWSTGQIETDEFSANDLTILRAYEWDRVNFSDPQKRKRTAAMMGITEQELSDIRRRTLDDARKIIRETEREK